MMESAKVERRIPVSTMAGCAVMAALMCILGPMSVPIGPVPVTLATLIVYLTVFVLGTKKSLITYLVYMLLGMAGLPVFSGYSGGIGKLLGPTGGYLVGYVFIALVGGLVMERFNRKTVPTYIGMVAGTALTYLCGTIWFVIQAKCTVGYAMSVCVIPFIPFDLVKIALAILLGKAVYSALKKSGLNF